MHAHTRNHFLSPVALMVAALLVACGPTSEEHNAVLNDLEATRASLEECRGNAERLAANAANVTDRLEAASLDLTGCESELATAMDRVSAYANEARIRDQIYEQMVAELQDMIDAGHLEVRIDNGRLVLDLPNEVLFDSGEATLNDQGRAALTQIAAALSRYPDREFQVEGHTDTVPISNANFDSNWELSTARAVTVVDLLIGRGVGPEQLSAAGYGEFEPKADNETTQGRALNRRVEIVMQPNLDRLRDIHANRTM